MPSSKGKRNFCLLVLSAAATIFLVVLIIKGSVQKNIVSNSLSVWINQAPFTSDPYEFDVGAHHVVYGPIFAKLFTQYRDSVTSPVLVKSWESEGPHLKWKFEIRKDVRFSNGDLISAKDVERSFKRIIFLSRKSKSKFELIDAIRGVENLISIDTEIAGISSQGDYFFIELTKPYANLLDLLSFGLFGIVHKTQFDPITGNWLENLKISSGPYLVKIESPREEKILLSLREDYPHDLYLKNSFQNIVIGWNRIGRDNFDLIEGFEGEPTPSPSHHFLGTTGADIVFLQCFGWQHAGSPFHEREARVSLRESFYDEFVSRNGALVRSFYPLTLPGVVPVASGVDGLKKWNFEGKVIKVRPPKNIQVPMFSAIKEALIDAIKKLNGVPQLVEGLTSQQLEDVHKEKGNSSGALDLATRSTTIGNEDPLETTRLMFSKEGIGLPDPTGNIVSAIRNGSFSAALVNRILFDDGLVWPAYHYSQGFWAKPELDFKRYNKLAPLSELQWIGIK